VRDPFKAINKAMREIVGWIDPPPVSSAMMDSQVLFVVTVITFPRLNDTISSQVPHLGISRLEVLLHTESGLFGRILPISHGSELDNRLLGGPVAVRTSIARGGAFTTTALERDLDF